MAFLQIQFVSESLGFPASIWAAIPQGEQGERYPALYLLHDFGGDQTSWMRGSDIERLAVEKRMAVIFPAGHNSYFADMYRGKKYFEFITRELPRFCRETFPILHGRENCFIAGAGMGGYAAIKAGLCAPGVFSFAGSLSGELDVGSIYDHLPLKAAQDIFGPRHAIYGSNNDLLACADNFEREDPKPLLYLWCGTDRSSLYEENISFADQLRSAGFAPKTKWENRPNNQSGWNAALTDMVGGIPLKAHGGEA